MEESKKNNVLKFLRQGASEDSIKKAFQTREEVGESKSKELASDLANEERKFEGFPIIVCDSQGEGRSKVENLMRVKKLIVNADNVLIKTISPFWLPIETIKSERKFNQDYIKNINILKREFIGWRKCRGDGNCYYRSVFSGYLLKIFHFNTPEVHLLNFQNLLSRLQTESQFPKISSIHSYFSPISIPNQSLQERIQIYKKLEQSLQDPEFDLDLIELSRFLAKSQIQVEKSYLSQFISDSSIPNLEAHIQTMGNEAEGEELFLLPQSLHIQVHQINIFDRIVKTSYPELPDSINPLTVSIISKAQGHYDLLYPIADMECQGCSINEGAFYSSSR